MYIDSYKVKILVPFVSKRPFVQCQNSFCIGFRFIRTDPELRAIVRSNEETVIASLRSLERNNIITPHKNEKHLQIQ